MESSAGGKAIDHMERGGLQCRLIGRIVVEFRPWQPSKPASGPVAGETVEVHGDDLVRHLRLAVRLQPES
jgi:hypothetical protein